MGTSFFISYITKVYRLFSQIIQKFKLIGKDGSGFLEA